MRRLPVANLHPGMVLARPVVGDKGSFLLSAGVALTERYIETLRTRGVFFVDVEDPDTIDVEISDLITERTRINVTRNTYRILSTMQRAASSLRNIDPALLQGELASESFTRALRDAAGESGYQELVGDLAAIVDEVAEQALLPGMMTIRSFDTYLFLHSIDSTIVAVMLGKKLGFDRARLTQLAAGCILHDIGMVTIDHAILEKRRLSTAEIELVRQHPRVGYEMLRQIRPREVIPNHVAYQHHERQDGTGYPRGLHGNRRVFRSELERHVSGRILLDAEICAVADVYDALGADRPFRQALPPDQVVRAMRALAGTQLNTELVTNLLEMVPVYPLGSEVVVKTGMFAGYHGVVARVDRTHREQPIVRILIDPRGQRIEPIELDLRREEAVIASAPAPRTSPPPRRVTAPRLSTSPAPAPQATRRPTPNPVRPASGIEQSLDHLEVPSKPGRVLVVDDDSMIAEVLRESLADAGHSVVVASSGREAIALSRSVDLVLLDLGLPDLDGMTVCRALRAAPETARLPVMILTARGDPNDRVLGIQSGADDYMSKPFNLAEVLARVDALLRSRRIEAALRERNRQLDTMRRLMTTGFSNVAVDQFAQRIVDAVPEVFGPQSGVLGGLISTVDRSRRVIRAHALTDVALAQRALELLGRPLREIQSTYEPPKNLQHEVARTGEPRTGERLAAFVSPTLPESLAWTIEQMVGMRAGICQPAKAQGHTIGVFLFILTKPLAEVSTTERSLMTEFADTAGIALENARLYAVGSAPTLSLT